MQFRGYAGVGHFGLDCGQWWMRHWKPAGSEQPVLRKEDLRLLRGRGRYTDDIVLDGQAYAVMLRSPHAHARIAGIDTGARARRRARSTC